MKNLKPLTQSEFAKLNMSERRDFFESLEAAYKPTVQQICKMLGGDNPISEKTLNLLKTQCGLPAKSLQRYHSNREQERTWAMFQYDLHIGEPKPEEPKPKFDKDAVNKAIAERIVKARNDAKLSLQDVADEMNVAKSTAARSEEIVVYAYYLAWICEKTGISADYIIFGKETKAENGTKVITKEVPKEVIKEVIKEVPKEVTKEKIVYTDNTQHILDTAFKEIGQQMEYLENMPKSMLTNEAQMRVGRDDVYKLAISDLRYKVAEIIAREQKKK